MNNTKKFNFISNFLTYTLGIALGTAWMTSIRIDYIGISEILFLIIFLFLFKFHGLFFFKSERRLTQLLKYFCIFFFIVLIPLNTLDHIHGNQPVYIPLYIICFFLIFLLERSLNNRTINLELVVTIFLFITITAIFVNYLIIELFFTETFILNKNFTITLSNNPNQLSLYLVCLLFLLSFYKKKFFIFLPAIVLAGILIDSRAFQVSLYSIIISVTVFYLIKKINNYKIIYFLLFCSLISFVLLIILNDQILNFIFENDSRGGSVLTRVMLLKNALIVIKQSPFIGNGIGAFSGRDAPFMGIEAHNTFLDFSMQFGIIFALIFYFFFILSVVVFFKKHEILIASTLVGLIIFTLFHYIGKHLIIYFIIAVLINVVKGHVLFDKNQFRNLIFKLKLKK